MNEKIQKLKGANMDIDLTTPQGSIAWQQDACPWNAAENTDDHECAVKNISICPYFCAVEYIDTLWCSYPNENPLQERTKRLSISTPHVRRHIHWTCRL